MSLVRFFTTATVCAVFTLASFPAFAQTRALSKDEKELAAYTLTMATVKKVGAALVALAAEMEKDPKVSEAKKLDAEIEALQKKDELTDAEAAQLEKLRERKEALEEQADDSPLGSKSNNESLDDMEAAIKRHPATARIFASHGVSPREYVLTMAALLQASMAVGFAQAGADLSKLPPGINPANIKFVQENKAALEEMYAAMDPKKKK